MQKIRPFSPKQLQIALRIINTLVQFVQTRHPLQKHLKDVHYLLQLHIFYISRCHHLCWVARAGPNIAVCPKSNNKSADELLLLGLLQFYSSFLLVNSFIENIKRKRFLSSPEIHPLNISPDVVRLLKADNLLINK